MSGLFEKRGKVHAKAYPCGGRNMLPDFIEIHRRAWTKLHQLSEAERDCIAAKFTVLHDLAPKEWRREGVQRLDRPEHLVPITEDLLAFFLELPNGRFLIQDFVRREFLNLYFPAALQMTGQT